jgi:hypothetical protein
MLYNIYMWMGASVQEAKVSICQNKNGIWHPLPKIVQKHINIISRANKLAVLRISRSCNRI